MMHRMAYCENCGKWQHVRSTPHERLKALCKVLARYANQGDDHAFLLLQVITLLARSKSASITLDDKADEVRIASVDSTSIAMLKRACDELGFPYKCTPTYRWDYANE